MNIALRAGQDKAWIITVTADGVAYDLTGCTIDFKAVDSDGTEVVSKSSSVSGEIDLVLTGDKNTATLNLVPADTTTRGSTQLDHALKLTAADSKVYPMGEGRIDIDAWVFDT